LGAVAERDGDPKDDLHDTGVKPAIDTIWQDGGRKCRFCKFVCRSQGGDEIDFEGMLPDEVVLSFGIWTRSGGFRHERCRGNGNNAVDGASCQEDRTASDGNAPNRAPSHHGARGISFVADPFWNGASRGACFDVARGDDPSFQSEFDNSFRAAG